MLLPGETWPRDVRVSGVAAMGLLWASVTATPTVTDASGSITALDPVEASAVGAAVPWPLLAVLVLAVLGAVFGPRWLRARRRRRQEAEDARVAEAVARSLAEKDDALSHAG